MLRDDSALVSLKDSEKPKCAKKAAPSRRRKMIRKSNPLLAIEDCGSDVAGSDGSEQDDDVDKSKKNKPPPGLTGTKVDKDLSRKWGTFDFSWVWRRIATGQNAGQIVCQWECRCPYHKNGGEDFGKCRKTKTFHDDEDCERQFQWLKMWALQGRWAQTRDGPQGHLNLDLKTCAFIPLERYDAELAVGLADDAWILKPPDDDEAEDKGPSGNEESSGSSSNSSSSSSSDSD